MISETDAQINATKGLADFGLLDRENWAEVYKDTIPRRPYLVQRLDFPESFYYIVPFENQGAIQIAVRVDANTGKFLQAVAADGPGSNVITLIDPNDIISSVLGRVLIIEARHVQISQNRIIGAPDIKWKPCIESFSPFSPFYRFIINAGSAVPGDEVIPAILYVSASDGKIVSRHPPDDMQPLSRLATHHMFSSDGDNEIIPGELHDRVMGA